MNGLDSPTAGYNITTRQELKARTWLLITNTERHMTRIDQWGHDTMNMTTNQNMTHRTEEPVLHVKPELRYDESTNVMLENQYKQV